MFWLIFLPIFFTWLLLWFLCMEYIRYYFSDKHRSPTVRRKTHLLQPVLASAESQIQVYRCWHEVQALLISQELEYQAAYRTCLSAIRSSSLAKWDKEIEIAMKMSDLKILLELLKHEQWRSDKPQTVNPDSVNSLPPHPARKKLNHSLPENSKTLQLVAQTNVKYQIMWFNQLQDIFVYGLQTINPGSTVAFGPCSMRLPADPQNYLDELYHLWTVQDRLPEMDSKILVLNKHILAPHPGLQYESGKITTLKLKSTFYRRQFSH